MATIFTTHGVVKRWNPSLLSDLYLLDHTAFKEFLKKQNKTFVDLKDALDGKGDAMTIDDSMNCAFNCAILARAGGHQVTLFVNPLQVEIQKPYPLSLLSVALDQTPLRKITWNDREYPLYKVAQKLKFRKAVKAAMQKVGDWKQRYKFIIRVCQGLLVPRLNIPPYLQPLSKEEILELKNKGVRLENHGFSHGEFSNLSEENIKAEIEKGKKWLKANFAVTSTAFAAPFGRAKPTFPLIGKWEIDWFLLDESLNNGRIQPRVYNRKMLILD
ncbi:polysaccharide deacetylase family protein [Candidatus Riflebacteria bacterium]